MDQIKIPKEVDFILDRLYKAGHRAYVVGGAIRNWILKRKISDWDVATSASSNEIKEIFKDRTVFSLKHDTVTVVLKGKNYEITPFKGRDLEDDLLHRDFTINAIAYDPEKGIFIDPANGRKDLEKKIIRATLDPYARFLEDPLRMLRAIRLSAELGFKIEKATMDAIKEMSGFIRDVSEERIRDEILKILVSPMPSYGIRLMYKSGIMEYTIPELIEGYGVRQNQAHKYTVFNHILFTLEKIDTEPILRLSALFHDIGKPRTKKKIKGRVVFYGHEKESEKMAKAIMKRLRFSNDMIENVCRLVRNHMINYSSEWSDAAIRRLINRVGKDLIFQLISLRKADLLAHGKDNCRLLMMEELENRVKEQIKKGIYSLKELKINGHIIMKELGIASGPKVGKILKALYEKVIENPELNKTDTLLSIAKKIKDFL